MGEYFANYDKASNTGTDWLGHTGVTMAVGFGTNSFSVTALADLINVQTNVGNGQTTTWDLTLWVQNVANGTWKNNGFAIWMGNATTNGNTDAGFTTDFRMTRTNYDGLVIDYTPASRLGTALSFW